jgi:hypothetical protein
MGDARRCFRHRWDEDRGDRDQPLELADFALFEISPEVFDAHVARLKPFNR